LTGRETPSTREEKDECHAKIFQAAFTPANTLRVRTRPFEPVLWRYCYLIDLFQQPDAFDTIADIIGWSPLCRPVKRIEL